MLVCDTPADRYEFYGYVHYPDGTRLGEREGDRSRTGSRAVILDKYMLLVKTEPVTVIPGSEYSGGTDFERHAFFEASSIRKADNKYYLIYSSEVMHELCYAVSDSAPEGFEYGGTLEGKSEYPSYPSCTLFTEKHSLYIGEEGAPKNNTGRQGRRRGNWLYRQYHRWCSSRLQVL